MQRIPAWTPLLGCAAVVGIALGACQSSANNGDNFVCPGTETAKVQQALLIPRCTNGVCHDSTRREGGLDLASPDLESRVVNAAASGCPGQTLLVPGYPESSYLVTKCEGTPACGALMPTDAPPLSTKELACLDAWITALKVDTNPCGSGKEACGSMCVDTQTDNENCGACDSPCPGGTSCVSGKCACPSGQDLCKDGCVDEQVSNTDCGKCDNPCGSAEACAQGTCACTGGLTLCGSSCVDTTGDGNHCGDCTTVCGANEVCANGHCMTGGCPPNLTQCGGSCVDTTNNPLHCGDCTTACGPGQTCSGSACVCPSGQKFCNGACVDVTANAQDCGMCNNVCSGTGMTCSNSSCVCTGSLTNCNGACVDTNTDAQNCGGCNAPCPNGETCSGGHCQACTMCNGACVDTTTDPNNCGACGFQCHFGNQACQNSQCTCTAGSACAQSGLPPNWWPDVCQDLQNSWYACGMCSKPCGQTQDCVGGACSACANGGKACYNQPCVVTQSSRHYCGSNCGSNHGTVCFMGQTCQAGACGPAPGTTACTPPGGSTVWVNLLDDDRNCGGCNQPCGNGQMCVNGACSTCSGMPVAHFATGSGRTVQAIFNDHASGCSSLGCHSGNTPESNLHLGGASAFADLQQNGWGQNTAMQNPLCDHPRVVAGNPANSLLILALTTGDGTASQASSNPPTACTELMPQRYIDLTQSDVDVIRTWVCQGAQNN